MSALDAKVLSAAECVCGERVTVEIAGVKQRNEQLYGEIVYRGVCSCGRGLLLQVEGKPSGAVYGTLPITDKTGGRS